MLWPPRLHAAAAAADGDDDSDNDYDDEDDDAMLYVKLGNYLSRQHGCIALVSY